MLAQLGTHITRIGFYLVLDSGIHIHVNQHVNTTPQIEPQVHRVRADGLQPGWNIGSHGQRIGVVFRKIV